MYTINPCYIFDILGYLNKKFYYFYIYLHRYYSPKKIGQISIFYRINGNRITNKLEIIQLV